MLCSSCGSDNPQANRFCLECGAALPAGCAKCGGQNPPRAKFCGICGEPLEDKGKPASALEPTHIEPDGLVEGERKIVTAVFADIKGSTELSQHLDPEEARALIDPALKLMIEAVQRYDGYVVQSSGDGIFALFGAPAAAEDHPQRALYAALAMQDSIKAYTERLRGEGKVPIELRVGAHTGEVVMRVVKTDEKRTEYNAIGHAANLAARMQPLAPVGSIAVTEHLQRLCEGYFQFRSLGEAHVKGITDPVNVYEVSGLGPLRTRLQIAAERGLTKFAGRQAEIDQMRRALELAQSGRGQILAAIGEPGIGKSRLFLEFKAIAPKDAIVLEAFSLSHGKASAYLPVIELLRSYFGISDEDDQRNRSEKIRSKILALDPSLEDTIPSLLGILGLVNEALEPKLGAGGSLDPTERETRKRRGIEAIKRVMLRESLNQLVVIIFQDLHWIDSETQSFLDLLADSIGSARVLLLVNYRPQYTHGWSNKTYYTQLRLDPLVATTASEILSTMLGEEADLLALKKLIIEKTEGNPFFIEEMVQKLFADGALVRNGAVKLARPISTIQIPETVQALLASRIDRLPVYEKGVLEFMSVVGRKSPLAILKRGLKFNSETDLPRLLHALQTAEFIYEQPAPPDPEYMFKHALTQEVAYNSILIERRKMFHEGIARLIEELYQPQLADHADELVRHYERSGNKEREIDFLLYAGWVAESRFAYAQAVTYLTKALRLLENSSRDNTAKEDCRFEILCNLGLSQAGDGDLKSGNRSIYAAAEIAKRRSDPKRIARAALALSLPSGGTDLEATALLEEALDGIGSEDSADKALVMSRLSYSMGYSQELVRARALAGDSVLVARRVGDKPALLYVLRNCLFALQNLRNLAIPDDVQERVALGLESQRLADDLKDQYEAWDIDSFLFEVFSEQGEMQSADEQLARLERRVEKFGDPRIKYVLTGLQAHRALMRGRFKEGQQLSYEALALGQQAHDPRAFENMGLQLAIVYLEEGHLRDLEGTFKSNVQANPHVPAFRCALATVYAEQGRRDEAANEFESLARSDFRDLPRFYNWLIGIVLLARVCDFLGDSKRASILYDLMAPYRRRNVCVAAVSLGSVEQYLALLAATMSRFEEAQSHAEAALEFNSKTGALPWVARTQYEYARMLLKWGRQDDRERACKLLAAAHETAERLGMKRVSEDAQALLSDNQS